MAKLFKKYINTEVKNEEVKDQETTAESEETETEEKEEKKMSKKKIGVIVGLGAAAIIGGAVALINKAKGSGDDEDDFYDEVDDDADDPGTEETEG